MNLDVTKNFKLLCNVISGDKNKQTVVDLSKVDEIINKKIPDLAKDNAPPDYYELFSDFKAEYDLFKDFILYDKLIGKNIVALGGGFSSGKSSFLNAINGEKTLPVDIDPSTSVPTYIVNGDKHCVDGINVFDSKVSIELNEIRKIAHGFGEVKDDDGNIIVPNVTLGHILESMFLSTPKQMYKNLALLDTPGYSKPDSEKYTAKTDEQIARNQLNSSNFIMWFIQADAGVITEEDIKFIKTLKEDIPKLIILNKADKKESSELQKIVAKVRDTLDLKGVRYVDVLTFSSVESDKHDADKIREQLAKWDNHSYEANFARNFKILFVKCREFYEDEIDDERRRLNRLNVSLTKLSTSDVDSDILSALNQLVKEIQKNISNLTDITKQLKELQDEFFTEMKYIGDIVSITMTEPSEIDLLGDIKPTFNDGYTGGNYTSTLADSLRDICTTDKVKFNDSYTGGNYTSTLADSLRESQK